MCHDPEKSLAWGSHWTTGSDYILFVCMHVSIIMTCSPFSCSYWSSSFDEFDDLYPTSLALTLYKDEDKLFFPKSAINLHNFFLLALFFPLYWYHTCKAEMVIPPPIKPPRIMKFLKPYVLKMHFTNKFVNAQVIHSPTATVASAASSQEKTLRSTMESTRDVAAAAMIGKILGERLLLQDIPAVTVFLKRDQKYHGKVKAVIDSLREVGIKLLWIQENFSMDSLMKTSFSGISDLSEEGNMWWVPFFIFFYLAMYKTRTINSGIACIGPFLCIYPYPLNVLVDLLKTDPKVLVDS